MDKTTGSSFMERTGYEIAVIGMAGGFPGARDIHEFWENLKQGIESIPFLAPGELQELKVDKDLSKDPHYVKIKGGVQEDKEKFDAAFFGYTPPEAEIMEPQLRLFLECAWAALEDAGYAADSYNGVTGIYGGGNQNIYWDGLARLTGKSEEVGQFAAARLTDKDYLCTRTAYHLDLTGPAVSINTACSTSLVAIHMACRGLLGGECDMALAGGVSILLGNNGYLYQEGMILSPDGHCRAFDLKISGVVPGEGVGVVVLKPLEEAIEVRDHIYAVIKGTAVNNDGKRKIGYTAPSIEGQVGVIKAALHMANICPESIGYIETHGTGTPIGDPIEFQALTEAFGGDSCNKKSYCALGSVKTNIGHLDTAAGVAGFIKTVLTLNQGWIPPSLHFEIPNPGIDFDNSPFYVNTRLKKWESNGFPRRAGVSSFGIGGTNAHVILEQAFAGIRGLAPLPDANPSRDYQLILLSAKTPSALERAAANLVEYLKKNPSVNLADVAFTLQVGRNSFKYRKMAVCREVKESIDLLSGSSYSFTLMEKDQPVIFLFSGLGAQYVNMGLGLYRREPVFRETFESCLTLLEPLMAEEIKSIIYPGEVEGGKLDKKKARESMGQTFVAQLTIFILEYALAKLLIHWGIKPNACIGYSFGEYTAACLSGVFSLEDALKLVVARGRLIRDIPAGAMLSVPVTSQEIRARLHHEPGELSVAIDNGPSCVVAGPLDAVNKLEEKLKKEKYMCMRLSSTHALHSPMMEPIIKEFASVIRTIPLNKPQIPFISNTNGTWITPEQAVDPTYWAMHLMYTVRFSDGINTLLAKDSPIFLEIGPGRDLTNLVTRHIRDNPGCVSMNTIRTRHQNLDDVSFLMNRLGRLWLYGKAIDWETFYGTQKRYRLSLPTYPFEGQRYWLDEDIYALTDEWKNKQLTTKISGMDERLYLPQWTSSIIGPGDLDDDRNKEQAKPGHWLFFLDRCQLGARLIESIGSRNHPATTVQYGSEFRKKSDEEFIINPTRPEDYDDLFGELKDMGRLPRRIVHLWGVMKEIPGESPSEKFKNSRDLGVCGLLFLVQALGRQELFHEIVIQVITNNMQDVTGEEDLFPEKATLLGPVRVIPQECQGIICRSIDVELSEINRMKERELIEQLAVEIDIPLPGTAVAYRGRRRWIQVFEPLAPEWDTREEKILKENGVYLVIGGLGEIGLILAEYLAKTVPVRLVLIGRSPFPPTAQWESWLVAHPEEDPTSQKIRRLQQLETGGVEVLLLQADIANLQQMQEVVRRVEERFGTIDGVFHAAGLPRPAADKTNTFLPVRELSHLQLETQFQAKVYGLWVLETILADKHLDFCIIISSISVVLGGLGFCAYAAANAFMDAFVKRHNRECQQKWITIDWDGMPPHDTAAAFKRILALDNIYHIAASSTGNLRARVKQWVQLATLRETNDPDPHPGTLQPRAELSSTYEAPRSQLECKMSQIWQKFFGLQQVGIQDDFFELGGDSLKAITLIARMHKELKITLTLAEFFKNPNVKSLAEHIEVYERKSQKIEKILSEIETGE